MFAFGRVSSLFDLTLACTSELYSDGQFVHEPKVQILIWFMSIRSRPHPVSGFMLVENETKAGQNVHFGRMFIE